MRARLRELFAPEGPALDLAVFRITVACVIAASASVAVADQWAALPEATRVAPLGVGWLVPHLPIDPVTVRVARVVLYAACASAALGIFSRASFTIVALALSYVLLVPQLGGAVFHDHHLLWFAVLLAASPCGDALSVDAWIAKRRARPRPTHGRAHGASVRIAWILIGLVFFFPGVHKLATSGLAWIWSDNLRNQIWWKWAQDPSLVPSLRIDRAPLVLRALAALTVIFELTFLPLVFWRRTRALVVIGALCFHQATDYFMGVRFTVLFLCYTVFVPWDAIVQRVHALALAGRTNGVSGRASRPGPFRRLASLVFKKRAPIAGTASPIPVAIAGVLLVLPVAGFGAAGAMQAYPFACYPTFEWIPDDHMPGLAIELERADGSRAELSRDQFLEPGPRGWALEWRLAGVYDGAHPERIDAWWRAASAREPLASASRGAIAVRFYRVSRSVDPDHPGRERSRRAIHRLALARDRP
jgi:hypothetical protein